MKTAFSSAAVASFALVSGAQAAYEPTWASLDRHLAAPDWFKDAKFGIYWHWGAYSVPAYNNEWYPRDMYARGNRVWGHHNATYGNTTTFPYQNFITGGNDRAGNFVQFNPVLASEGGQFDPQDWINVIKASGAKFAGPVAEHHDGYAMWNSSVNEWNTAQLGPGLDFAELWADLIRQNGLKYLVAMHHAFNTNGFFINAPNSTDPSLQKLYGKMYKPKSDKLWLDKQVDIINHVQPDIIWNDFGLDSPGYCFNNVYPCAIAENRRLEFLAYYFNKEAEWNKQVLTTYKHFDSGFRNTSAVSDFERGGPAELERPYWLTDDAISSSSWSYTTGIGYYSAKQMVHSIIDRVSKNGNVLLNISPTAAGVIPTQQKNVLNDIGAYLSRYGESIYATRAWDIYGEGPNKAGGGSFTKPFVGNSSDIRFTRNKKKTVLYATFLDWPASGYVNITSLGLDREVDLWDLRGVSLLGNSAGQYVHGLNWTQDAEALRIKLPAKPNTSLAYVLRLGWKWNIPNPQLPGGATLFTGANVAGAGVSLHKGQFNALWLADANFKPRWATIIRVANGATVTTYANGDFSGAATTYSAGTWNITAPYMSLKVN